MKTEKSPSKWASESSAQRWSWKQLFTQVLRSIFRSTVFHVLISSKTKKGFNEKRHQLRSRPHRLQFKKHWKHSLECFNLKTWLESQFDAFHWRKMKTAVKKRLHCGFMESIGFGFGFCQIHFRLSASESCQVPWHVISIDFFSVFWNVSISIYDCRRCPMKEGKRNIKKLRQVGVKTSSSFNQLIISQIFMALFGSSSINGICLFLRLSETDSRCLKQGTR